MKFPCGLFHFYIQFKYFNEAILTVIQIIKEVGVNMTLFFHSWESISCDDQIHDVVDEHDLTF